MSVGVTDGLCPWKSDSGPAVLTGRSLMVFDADADADADADPNLFVREDQVSPGSAGQGPRNGLLGAGAVEKVLTGLLRWSSLGCRPTRPTVWLRV